jgi:integrase
MALYKRNKTWWTDFSVNGQRYRESLDTSDWREAQTRERELIGKANAGRLAPSSERFARLGFSEAADQFLADRIAHLAARSIQTEKERMRPLKAYLGAIPLMRISADLVRQYVAQRKSQGMSNKTVNLELSVLRGVLKRAKRWQLMADDIKPLPVRHCVGRALSHEEKARLIKAAGERPDWENARLAMTLALNTTMRSCELKGLRWRDVNLMDRLLSVQRGFTKTDAGERIIPLNGSAWAAIRELWDRAKALGGASPDHFVFPACENKHIDPMRPMKSWRSAWRNLTRCAGLAGLRFHDLRHHAITELSESNASEQTIMSIAGHLSRQMLEHYSHVRLEAKRNALDALSAKPAKATRGEAMGHGTNNVTIDPDEDTALAASDSKEWSGRMDLNHRPPGPEPESRKI